VVLFQRQSPFHGIDGRIELRWRRRERLITTFSRAPEEVLLVEAGTRGAETEETETRRSGRGVGFYDHGGNSRKTQQQKGEDGFVRCEAESSGLGWRCGDGEYAAASRRWEGVFTHAIIEVAFAIVIDLLVQGLWRASEGKE
jgi:hypothetical protein